MKSEKIKSKDKCNEITCVASLVDQNLTKSSNPVKHAILLEFNFVFSNLLRLA